jgi:hypothetical protein
MVENALQKFKPLGAYLFKQGDPVDYFYITAEGSFLVSKRIKYQAPVRSTLTKEINIAPLRHLK